MANYKNSNSVIFDKEIEVRKLNEQLETAKASIPKLEKQKSEIFNHLPSFMQNFLNGNWGRGGGYEQQNSFESIYNQNPSFHSQWQNYQNVQQQINNYKNQIAQLPTQIKTERENIENLRKAETDQLKAEILKLKELERNQEELDNAKAKAEEFSKNTEELLKSNPIDPNSEEYQNLIDAQTEAAQKIQKLVDEREQIKGADPLQISNQNNEQTSNQEGTNKNKSALDYYNDSASILAKHPDLAAQYNRNKINNPREALETLVQNAYEKDISSGDTDNLIKYRDIIDKIDEENLEQDIKEREAKAKEEIEKANINPKTKKPYTEEERKADLEAMFNNKEGYPAADMNNLTFAGKPIWYNNLLKNIGVRTAQLTSPEKPYSYYTKPRIAKPSKEETIAYDLLSKNLLKPEYEESYKETLKNLKNLQEKTPSENLDIADKRAKERTTNENIEDYVNPKTNSVLDLIQKRAMRNFQENIMPKVSAPFIARGSFNTGARAEAQARARRDLMEGLMDNETQYLASAYDKARETASTDKKTYLNYRLAKAELESDEILKKGKLAEDTSNLMDTFHKNKLLDMEALRTVGQSQRDVEQRKLDLQHQEFENEINYPIRQVDILNKMVHQLPVGSIIGESSNTAKAPTFNEKVSPWQTGAGLFGQMAAMNMMNKAEGGMIQRYANGGMIDKMKDQYLQDLMTRAQTTGGNTQNPWAHYMLGLSNSLASSRNPDVIGALAEGSTQGVGQFMHAKEYNKGLEDQNLAFKKSIIDYLDKAEDRKLNNRLHEAQIQKVMAEIGSGDILSKPLNTLDPSGNVVVPVIKNGRLAGVNTINPQTGESKYFDYNVMPQGINQQSYQTAIPTEFNEAQTPRTKELFEIAMNPKLPTNAAEKEYYDQDIKNLTKLQEEAQKAKENQNKLETLKSNLPNLNTGLLAPIGNLGSEASYSLGLGKGKAATAAQAFKESKLVDLADAKRVFDKMTDRDVESAKEMSTNTRNTIDSIKENTDAKLAAVKLKQIEAKAKEIYFAKYGNTRGFDLLYDTWLKNIKVFKSIKNKKTKEFIRKGLNEESLETWPEMLNPNFLEKYAGKQSETNSNNLSEINKNQKYQLQKELEQ